MIEAIRSDLFRIEVPLPDSPLKALNSYVIRSSQRNLIIDTGLNHDVCYEAMQAGLQQLDIDLARTDFFITHLHADHFGLISKLNTEMSLIYFNRPEAEIIEVQSGWEPMIAYAAQNGFPKNELRSTIEQHPGHKFSSEWVPELNILQDGDTIHIGAYHFKCVATSGHSMGHMCLYEPTQKIFVAGDHILIDITPNIQCWSDAQNPLGRYFDSLDRVYDLEVDLVLPGHRRLITDHRARIIQLKVHHKKRLGEILDILGSGDMSAFEVASKMSWDINCDSWEVFPPAQKWFAVGEAIAHLRYLEAKGRITRRIKGNLFRFAIN
ncbi:MAG: MBL fold metallo-hydrolase [Desulfobacterales bacterium]|nr:MAG: MBL fold metallo-hydrolase [Desulfobacterales bacterium]